MAAAGQEMEVPRISSVTVNESGQPVLRWQMASPSAVDGYIIKRLIVDGEGVISGTWNNVAVIEDNSVFEYTDNSTSYGTQARPLERREFYRISSFRKADGHTYYSLMSDELSTIQIQASYDFCSNSYRISCTEVENAVRYIIHSGDSQKSATDVLSNYSIAFDDYQEQRPFYVECVLRNNTILGSPIITVDAEASQIPEHIAINAIAPENDRGGLQLLLNVSATESISRAELWREYDNSVCKLELPVYNLSNYVFHDGEADPLRLYGYRIVTYNSCDQVLAESQVANNIVLEVSQQQEGNLLTWNRPCYVSDDDMLDINLVDDGAAYVNLYRLSGNSTSLLHVIDADNEGGSGNFCYQVLCCKSDNKELVAASNIACTCKEPVIYIPNALNPNSDNEDNRFFKPYAEFVSDYQLTVFDKRGAAIFQSSDISIGWDGRNRASRLCPRDTYVYIITYTSANGKRYEKRGFVNLVY